MVFLIRGGSVPIKPPKPVVQDVYRMKNPQLFFVVRKCLHMAVWDSGLL